MSNGNDAQSGLGAFLQTFSAPVLMVISVISSIHGFVKLFADKDAGLITIVSLAIGILLLFGVCLYYARFWKPEAQDKSTSAFAPAPSDQQVKAQAKKEKQRKTIRRSAIAGLVLIPILTIAGMVGWQHLQNLPTKDIVILIADFEGPEPQNYRVTETIQENLENAIEEYSDVKVKALGKPITRQQGSKVAREEGEKEKAAIVIWGWYGKTKEVVSVSTNFELLKQPENFPELGQGVKGQVRTAAVAELESFQMQTQLSKEMAYLELASNDPGLQQSAKQQLQKLGVK
ncbi:MAG: hypothetical protein HC866_09780 [Leptolyngbyaceae cyanobacterium RU_5_1]|nr:hypothetical protein [Leptolyngbyaceae cyanobacterium RU_5_1]